MYIDDLNDFYKSQSILSDLTIQTIGACTLNHILAEVRPCDDAKVKPAARAQLMQDENE